MREALNPGLSIHFNVRPTWDLFANDGDLVFTLRDENEAVLQTTTLTRETLVVIEQTLRELSDRVSANLQDKEHRCRLEPEREIVVT